MSDSAPTSGAEEAVVWHLVRHGETDWNRSRRIQGQVDVALNQNGRDQVARLERAAVGCRIFGDLRQRTVAHDGKRAPDQGNKGSRD